MGSSTCLPKDWHWPFRLHDHWLYRWSQWDASGFALRGAQPPDIVLVGYLTIGCISGADWTLRASPYADFGFRPTRNSPFDLRGVRPLNLALSSLVVSLGPVRKLSLAASHCHFILLHHWMCLRGLWNTSELGLAATLRILGHCLFHLPSWSSGMILTNSSSQTTLRPSVSCA